MESGCLGRWRQGNRRGVAVVLVFLVVFVLAALIWLDPFVLFRSRDPELPWNQEHRIVKRGEPVARPSKEQVSLSRSLIFSAKAKLEEEQRGKIKMWIGRDGRIEGHWTGEYEARAGVKHAVMSSGFEGNIDPTKIYKDEYGEDRSQLYFITEGKFIILEENSQTGRNRGVKGRIYVTGWVDTEHNARGEITITSDRKSFKTFSWQAKAEEGRRIFNLFK